MGAENEAKTVTNDGKKRKRCYLPHNKPMKKKGMFPLRPGVQGFFLTCDGGRERDASHEAINVIDSFLEELIDGEDSVVAVAAIPKKAMNTKIKFEYSDSSDSEGDDEDDKDNDSKEEKEKLEGPPKDVASNENLNGEISDCAKKNENSQEAVTGKSTETHEEKSEEGPPKDDASSENLNGENSDCSKKDDQSQEAPTEKSTENLKEVDHQHDDCKNDESDENLPKKQCLGTEKIESKSHDVDDKWKPVDRLIEDELKELADKGKRRFSKVDTGCNGVGFIQMRKRDGDPSPTKIVQHMMNSVARTKKHLSRFLLRVLPVEVSCYASAEEISRAIKPVIDQYFPADAETPVKFAVQYDARANSGIERMTIIDAVAKSVPAPHRVDLKNPDKTIVVQIIKTVCLIGVVEKYKELAKYNLRQLSSSEK